MVVPCRGRSIEVLVRHREKIWDHRGPNQSERLQMQMRVAVIRMPSQLGSESWRAADSFLDLDEGSRLFAEELDD